MIISISLAVMALWYIIPQQQEQQAIADSGTKITTVSGNTDQNNLKPSININNNNNNFLSYQNRAFGIAIQYLPETSYFTIVNVRYYTYGCAFKQHGHESTKTYGSNSWE
jgi:hypothetical protein